MLQFEPEERDYGNLNMSLILLLRDGGDLANEFVLRSTADGMHIVHADIGDHLEIDQIVAEINSRLVLTPFMGVLHDLLHPGFRVWKGLKIDDVDPGDDLGYCTLVSDKSLAFGGGVLEAILSRPELRPHIWN
ncbi:hypothetical protein ACFLUA_02770 [Chloroflexota bacterium]